MLDRAAFKALSGNEVKLLILVCKKHFGMNNGEIACSVREAAEFIGCTPNTAGKCFAGLQERGFVEVTRKGAFSVKDRKATLWRVTAYPSPGGKPATRDYARWKPSTDDKN
jgi:predicted transcriptional regulator of viral defense system